MMRANVLHTDNDDAPFVGHGRHVQKFPESGLQDQVGNETENGRQKRGAAEHKQAAEQLQRGRRGGQTVVAIAGGSDGGNDEIQGVNKAQFHVVVEDGGPNDHQACKDRNDPFDRPRCLSPDFANKCQENSDQAHEPFTRLFLRIVSAQGRPQSKDGVALTEGTRGRTHRTEPAARQKKERGDPGGVSQIAGSLTCPWRAGFNQHRLQGAGFAFQGEEAAYALPKGGRSEYGRRKQRGTQDPADTQARFKVRRETLVEQPCDGDDARVESPGVHDDR